MSFRPALVLALALLSLAPVARAGQGPQDEEDPKARKETWMVLVVDGNYEVIEKSGLNARKKELDEAFKARTAAWTKAKAAAKKEKKTFSDPKPTKPKLKNLPKTFLTRDAAQAYAKEVQAAEAKKREKKKGSERSKGKDKEKGKGKDKPGSEDDAA